MLAKELNRIGSMNLEEDISARVQVKNKEWKHNICYGDSFNIRLRRAYNALCK